MDGEPVRAPLSARARRGLALITDDRGIFRSLTVRENLRLSTGPVSEALAFFPALEALLDRKAGLLSGGEQQMLALARVPARRPRILLADEISLGLAPIIVTQLMTALRRAADSGSAALVVPLNHDVGCRSPLRGHERAGIVTTIADQKDPLEVRRGEARDLVYLATSRTSRRRRQQGATSRYRHDGEVYRARYARAATYFRSGA